MICWKDHISNVEESIEFCLPFNTILWFFTLTTKLHSSKLVSGVFSHCQSRIKVSALVQLKHWKHRNLSCGFCNRFCYMLISIIEWIIINCGGINPSTVWYLAAERSDTCMLNLITILAERKKIGINLFEDWNCGIFILCVVLLLGFGFFLLFLGFVTVFVKSVFCHNSSLQYPCSICVKSFLCNL